MPSPFLWVVWLPFPNGWFMALFSPHYITYHKNCWWHTLWLTNSLRFKIAIYSWFAQLKWWFSIVFFCLFTRGYPFHHLDQANHTSVGMSELPRPCRWSLFVPWTAMRSWSQRYPLVLATWISKWVCLKIGCIIYIYIHYIYTYIYIYIYIYRTEYIYIYREYIYI